ncbi:hypothetical protein Tco_1319076 [Tanacetum coccineum]
MKGKEVATCEISDLKLSKSQSSNVRLGQQTVIIQPSSTGFEYPAAYAGTSNFRGNCNFSNQRPSAYAASSNFRGVSKLSLFPHVAERSVWVDGSLHVHSSTTQFSLGGFQVQGGVLDCGKRKLQLYTDANIVVVFKLHSTETQMSLKNIRACVAHVKNAENMQPMVRQPMHPGFPIIAGSTHCGSFALNQAASSEGAHVNTIGNTQGVHNQVLNLASVILQGSNQRKRTYGNTQAESAMAKEPSSKRVRRSDLAATKRRRSTVTWANGEGSSSNPSGGSFPTYDDLGDCDQRCLHYGAAFWYEERLKGHSNNQRSKYHLCCRDDKIYMEPEPDPPE